MPLKKSLVLCCGTVTCRTQLDRSFYFYIYCLLLLLPTGAIDKADRLRPGWVQLNPSCFLYTSLDFLPSVTNSGVFPNLPLETFSQYAIIDKSGDFSVCQWTQAKSEFFLPILPIVGVFEVVVEWISFHRESHDFSYKTDVWHLHLKSGSCAQNN